MNMPSPETIKELVIFALVLLGIYFFARLLGYILRGIPSGLSKPERIVIIDPERLHQVPADKAYAKKYNKYKNTYGYGQAGGTNLAEAQRRFREKGRKVRCWRLVKSHSDFSFDEYVPIFSKGRKKPKKHKNKGHKGRGDKTAQKRRAKQRKKKK